MKIHQLVEKEDLPVLSTDLLSIFEDICQSALITDPYDCLGLRCHALKGKLRNHRSLGIEWEGIAYRLVYRIYESPAPRRVEVLSFAEHDPAYERAIERRR